MTKQSIDQNTILDEALKLAQQSSWEAFSLTQLASSLDCGLDIIRHHFRSKDDMAELFFDRADEMMLKKTGDKDFLSLPCERRLLESIMCWFIQLQSHKSIVREMLFYKLEPGHFHLQAHGITRVSRTVQWFREVSGREHSGLSRIADEIAVTSAYLAALSFFLLEQNKELTNTRALLSGLIDKIERTHQVLAGGNQSKLNKAEW